MAGSERHQPGERDELLFPQAPGFLARLHLRLLGRWDARSGRAHVSDEGYLTSPFLRELVERANHRILAEWQDCNGEMFERKPQLLEARRDLARAEADLSALTDLREAALAQAQAPRPGDAGISPHMASKRRGRRTARVEAAFDARDAEARARAEAAQSRIEAILCEFQDFRDAAITHERLVRAEYREVLASYARGAMKAVPLDPACVNDGALTETPMRENDGFFAAYVPDDF